MSELTATDVSALEELLATTHLMAAGGGRTWNATTVSTGHTIYCYVNSISQDMKLMAAQEKIKRGREWAMVHITDESRYSYELFIDGSKFGNLQDDELLTELGRCIADPKYR